MSWTFRILAHEENQYNYVNKILGHFLSEAPKQTEAGPRRKLLFQLLLLLLFLIAVDP